MIILLSNLFKTWKVLDMLQFRYVLENSIAQAREFNKVPNYLG